MSNTGLLTSPQAGVILGKSARTIQRMADAGDLPFVQKLDGPNGAYLFDPEVIAAHRLPSSEVQDQEQDA
jgi:hypothetical protein